MIPLIQRNLLLFFRNKRGVVSSLTSALIVILLYVCFLGDSLRSSLQVLGDVDLLISTWILAGFLSVVSMTSAIGAMSQRICDHETGKLRDFTCSPLRPYQIAGAYLCSSFLVGMIMSVFAWIVSEIYLLASGGSLPALQDVGLTFLSLTLSVLASTAMMSFLVSLFHSMATFSTVSTIVSTLAGFLTGVYVPIGSLPLLARNIITFFPLSHGTSLLRQSMMRGLIEENLSTVSPALLHDFHESLGILYYMDDKAITKGCSILILCISALLFYGFSILITKRKHG